MHGALEEAASAARRCADLLSEACMSSQFRSPPAVTRLTTRAANGRTRDALRTLRGRGAAPVGGGWVLLAEEGLRGAPKLRRLELRPEGPQLLLYPRRDARGFAAQQAFGGQQCPGRLFRHGTGQRSRLIHQRLILGHAVDDAQRERTRRIEWLAEEQQLRGALMTDQPRQQQRARRLGYQAQ